MQHVSVGKIKSFDPFSWGPSFWITAHTVASTYPLCPSDTDKEHYRTFFNSFQHIIPCESCQQHWNEEVLPSCPLTNTSLSSREALSKWVMDAHNIVNIHIHRKQVNEKERMNEEVPPCEIYTWEQLTEKYFDITMKEDLQFWLPPYRFQEYNIDCFSGKSHSAYLW